MKRENPTFTLTVFLPALIFGPPIQPLKVPAVKNLNFSVSLIYGLFNGSSKDKVPPTMFPSYIDVRDLATAHVKALTTGGAKNKRFLLGGAPLDFGKAVGVLEEWGGVKGRLPLGKADEEVVVPKIEAREGNQVLGLKFRTFEETIIDTAKKILELERQG